jgi:hypothetical protein
MRVHGSVVAGTALLLMKLFACCAVTQLHASMLAQQVLAQQRQGDGDRLQLVIQPWHGACTTMISAACTGTSAQLARLDGGGC